MAELDDHMGGPWEEAVRLHLRRVADRGELGADVVAIGRWWKETGGDEIDAVVLSGRERSATMVGEAKWTRGVDGGRLAAALLRKAEELPRVREPLRLAVAAREHIRNVDSRTLAITAADIF